MNPLSDLRCALLPARDTTTQAASVTVLDSASRAAVHAVHAVSNNPLRRRCHALGIACAAAMLLSLSGCATAPAFETLPASPAPAAHIVAADTARFLDQPVVWGGMIMEVNNYERHTEIELLAYPLDERQRPLLEQPDQGRFIAILPGYVEARDYPPGRFLSLIGRVTGDRRGSLRGAEYVWPEVDVDRMFLWPRDFREPKTRFSVGVGVRL